MLQARSVLRRALVCLAVAALLVMQVPFVAVATSSVDTAVHPADVKAAEALLASAVGPVASVAAESVDVADITLAAPDPDDDIPGVAYAGPVAGSVDVALDSDDVYSITLAQGERLTITLTDDALLDADIYVYGPGSASITNELPYWGSTTSGSESVVIDARTGMAGTYYMDVHARVGGGSYDLTAVISSQPVGAWENVGDASVMSGDGGLISGSLTQNADCNDVWYSDLLAGDRLTLELAGDEGTDFDVYVYGPDSADLAAETPVVYSFGWTSDEYVTLDVTDAGRYYVEVRVFSGSGAYALDWQIAESPAPDAMVRLGGRNRYDTAIEVSESTFANNSCSVVVVASGENFPDALAAAPLAGMYQCPLLLTAYATLPSGVLEEINRLGATDVIIVGGTPAVSSDVQTALTDAGLTVSRIYGSDRYETAAKVAEAIVNDPGSEWQGTAFLVRGDVFADALAVAPLAYSQGYPVLLTRTTELVSVTQKFINDEAVQDVVIAGGTPAVSAATEAAVAAQPTVLRVERIAGADRYETAKLTADYGIRHQWVTAEYVGVATGENFPDALGGGAACGLNGGVLLLTSFADLSPAPADFVATHASEIMHIEVYGSDAAVSSAVTTALGALLP